MRLAFLWAALLSIVAFSACGSLTTPEPPDRSSPPDFALPSVSCHEAGGDCAPGEYCWIYFCDQTAVNLHGCKYGLIEARCRSLPSKCLSNPTCSCPDLLQTSCKCDEPLRVTCWPY